MRDLESSREHVVVISDQNDEPPLSYEIKSVESYKQLEPGSSSAVIALDSSAIPLAYNETTWMLVASVALAIRQGGRESPPKIVRLGPYLVGIKRGLGDDQQQAARRLREYLEDLVVRDIIYSASTPDRLLLLVDGTLDRLNRLDCVTAKARNIVALGVSKSTKLVPPASELLPLKPSYAFVRRLEGCGEILVARLSSDGVLLRIDVTDVNGLKDLLASDTVYRGYPDLLRIAHYASLLSISEEESARALLASQKVRLVRYEDRRRLLLGALKVRA